MSNIIGNPLFAGVAAAQFDRAAFEREKDKEHILFIKEKCVKGCTLEHLSDEEAQEFYDGFVKERMLYHYPEDTETLWNIVETYNYLNRWK